MIDTMYVVVPAALYIVGAVIGLLIFSPLFKEKGDM